MYTAVRPQEERSEKPVNKKLKTELQENNPVVTLVSAFSLQDSEAMDVLFQPSLLCALLQQA